MRKNHFFLGDKIAETRDYKSRKQGFAGKEGVSLNFKIIYNYLFLNVIEILYLCR